MKKSVRIIITGSIQPVFFNQFIKENAEKLGVAGFVRGLPDGRAEIFIEGSLDAVNQMIPLCKRGPQHAQIRSVEEKPEHFQGLKGFKVLGF